MDLCVQTRVDLGYGGSRAAFGVVDVRQWYAAPPHAVLDAWLDPAIARRWLFATARRPLAFASIDARPGGTLRLVPGGASATIDGRIAALVRPGLLVIELGAYGINVSVLTASLQPAGSGTALHVRHAGVSAADADWLEGRWTGILYGLGEALDCDSHELAPDLESQ